MRRDADAYLYKDFGAAHFGDFEHLFTFHFTSGEAGDITDRPWAAIDTLSDDIGSLKDNGENCFGVQLYQENGVDDTLFFRLRQRDGGAEEDVAKSAFIYGCDLTLYMTLKRDDTTGTLKIYSDAGRTDLIETLTITCTTTTYRYLHAVRSMEGAADVADHISGYIANLNLQEPPIVTMIGGPTGWEWGEAVKSESVVRITSDGGLTWIWGLAVGTITIPVGGPLGWEWEEFVF